MRIGSLPLFRLEQLPLHGLCAEEKANRSGITEPFGIVSTFRSLLILLITPRRNLRNQIPWQRFGIGQPDRSLAYVIIRQLLSEKRGCFSARI